MSTVQGGDASIYANDPAAEIAGQSLRLSQLARGRSGRLRRSTLLNLRWAAVLGQSFAVLVVYMGLGFPLPIVPAFLVIGVSVLLNIIVIMLLPFDRRVSDSEACAQLGFDLLQLAILLWLTGGMKNPFALLFLAPVVTSATTLSRPVVASLGLFAAALSFALLFDTRPLPWSPPGSFTLPFTFMLGSWIALMTGMVFTSLYAWRSATEARRMSEALAATEAVLAHEQKLAALGGLAAAAAHELGTPLATIQLTAKEMARDLDPATPLGEDAQLLLSQTIRCRDILKQLALRGDEGDVIHDQMSLDTLMREAADPFFGMGADIHITASGEGAAPPLGRQAELLYGLKNFIENAVGFTTTSVWVTGWWDPNHIIIRIEDDGAGFDPGLIGKLGEPYVSGRDEAADAGGLGLGVFIATTLIERTGGTAHFSNRKPGGARVNLQWPRSALEI